MTTPTANDLLIDIAIAASTKGAIEDIRKLELQLQSLRNEAARTKANLKTMFDAGTITNQTYVNSVKKVNQELGEELPKSTEKASKGLWSLRNVTRTALGTLEAMAIFLVTRFVGQAVTKAVDSIAQLELAIFKLQVAEKSLSESGIDISVKDLKDIANGVKEVYSYISDIDALKLVSTLSLTAKDLKLTKEQIEDIAKSIPAIAFQAGITIDEATSQIINGLSKHGRGWADLKINVNDAIIRQNAVKMGLVASEEAYKNLNAEQQQHIEVLSLINILTNSTTEAMNKQAEMSNTVVGVERDLNATWENTATVFGEFLKPVLVAGGIGLILFLQAMQGGLVVVTLAMIEFVSATVGGVAVIDAALKGNIKSIDDLTKTFTDSSEKIKASLLPQIFPGGVPNLEFGTSSTGKAKVDINKMFGLDKYIKDIDTQTALTTGAIENQAQDITDALEKAQNSIDDELDNFKFDKRDIKIDFDLKLEDIGLKLSRALEDAKTDYYNKLGDINASTANKVSDINKEANQKRAEANAKAHADELNAEAEFQNKLLEMREKFLMDLDDALHARDARQVLRLIKQYNLERTQAIRENALKAKERQRELAQSQKEIADDRARRIEDARQERDQQVAAAKKDYEEKQAQLKLNADRERADALTDYNRKMQDLQRHFNDKMEALGRNLQQEYNLTVAGAEAVRQALLAYYGPGGAITAIWQAYAGMIGGIRQPTVPSSVTAPNVGGPGTGVIGGGGRRYAEGGTLFANRPTTLTFGEAGLEMAQITPIGRQGRDINKIFGNLGGSMGSNAGGNLKLQVVMSEGLIASIVDTSLQNVTSVIETVRRERR